MPDFRYHIIFSTLIEGRQPEQVHRDLADLFEIDQELVQQIFACQGAVVKSDLDRATAEQYVQVILAAGAICVIEPMPSAISATEAACLAPEALDDFAQVSSSPVPRNDTEVCVPNSEQITQQEHAIFREGDGDVPGFRAPVFAALLLLAGVCVPILSASGQMHWPWQFAFEPQPPGLLWWVVVPVVAAGMFVLFRAPAFSLILVFMGAAALLGITVVFWEAALIMPLHILPLDRAAALAYVLPLLGVAVCSAVCSAMGELGELIMLRLLAVCGSLAVLIPAGIALFTADTIWGRWPLILLLLLLLLYAVLMLVCACLSSVSGSFLYQVRLLGIVLMCWAPVAVFMAHLPLIEPDTGSALVVAVLKAGFLYYGALAAIAGGLRTEFLYRFEK